MTTNLRAVLPVHLSLDLGFVTLVTSRNEQLREQMIRRIIKSARTATSEEIYVTKDLPTLVKKMKKAGRAVFIYRGTFSEHRSSFELLADFLFCIRIVRVLNQKIVIVSDPAQWIPSLIDKQFRMKVSIDERSVRIDRIGEGIIAWLPSPVSAENGNNDGKN